MAVARSTGLAWGTISYHLDALETDGRIATLASGKEIFLFRIDVPVDHRGWLSVLQCEQVEAVVRLIGERREVSIGEAMTVLGLPRKLVKRLISRLEAQRLIARLGTGRARYALGDAWPVASKYGPKYGLGWVAQIRPIKLATATPTGPALLALIGGTVEGEEPKYSTIADANLGLV